MKEQARSAVWQKGDVCWVQNSKQPSLLQHLELSFTSFHRDGAEVGVAGSQDRWFLLGQAASSGSALAQALHAPGLHSPATGHRALSRGENRTLSFIAQTLGAPESQRGSFQGPRMRLSKQERAGSGVLLFTNPHQGQLFEDVCIFWLFKDSAENLVPYLGIDTETEHFRNLFLIVCIDFF